MNKAKMHLNQTIEWEKCFKSMPDSKKDIYYSLEYYLLYKQYNNGEPQAYIFKKNDELAIYPFLYNSINELGYKLDKEYFDIQGAYGYNGVISTTCDKNFINDFYHSFDEYCYENNIVTEFTRFHPLLNNVRFSDNHLKTELNRKTVYVDLSLELEEIVSKFSKSNKRAIKKAKKNNIEIKILKSGFLIDEFINIYNKTMQRVGSREFLFFSKKYFEELFKMKNLIQFCAYHNKTLIASTVCIYSKDFFNYHLGASLSEFLEFRPNNLLFLEMIKFSKLKNCKFLFLGGGSTTDEDDTLLRYKASFSNQNIDFQIGERILRQNIYNNITEQWMDKFPESYKINHKLILGYRSI